MAKRSNPFIEDYVQQSKVHVGIKHFNKNEGRLQKVYEKTLDLLFRGAKGKGAMTPVTPVVPQERETAQNKFKQLFIGKNGALKRDGSVVVSDRPQLCACVGGISDCNCAYCEARLCQQCAHTCTSCEQSYCARCCIGASEGGEMCVSCYD